MKYSLKSAVAVILMATTIASAACAVPAKKKAAPKRATISQSVSNYSCEGTDARITRNALNGNSRSEYKLSFGMQLNRSNGTATITVSYTHLDVYKRQLPYLPRKLSLK